MAEHYRRTNDFEGNYLSGPRHRAFSAAVALAATVAVFPLMATSLSAYASAASVMGMKIDSVQTNGAITTITTTGAELVFDQSQNSIVCSQRIPKQRQLATINGLSLNGLTVQSRNDQQVVLSAPGGSLTVGADGLLTIALAADAKVRITGSYKPAWQRQEGKHLFLPDATGGVGLYLLGKARIAKPASWNDAWTVNYQTESPSQLLVSVYPPRPFDVNQSLKTIVHDYSSTKPYPSDSDLEAWSKIGPVLVLHSWIWQGTSGKAYGVEQDNSWATTTFEPKDKAEMRRVVNTAHRLGMKVVPYMSPLYFGKPEGGAKKDTMPQFLSIVKSRLADYGFDGAYFDGVYLDDIQGSHDLVRQAREMLGDDGILFLHVTSDPLRSMPCPFIDTYATYIMRGEHRQLTDDYARWMASSYNLGNTIGTFCYDTVRPDSRMIDLLLSVNARMLYWPSDGTWFKWSYHLKPNEMDLMHREYFPKLKAISPKPANDRSDSPASRKVPTLFPSP